MTDGWAELTPRRIVAELDRDIVGQGAAKRAVAVAIRNRMRRQRLDDGIRADVNPKNIILIGPTGVGKTEIGRRLAQLLKAPFVKVEATKFTEVGYMGRDVDSMVRDLATAGIAQVKNEEAAAVEGEARRLAEEALLDALERRPGVVRDAEGSVEDLMARIRETAGELGVGAEEEKEEQEEQEERSGEHGGHEAQPRSALRVLLHARELEDVEVEVTVREAGQPGMDLVALGPGSEEMEIQFRSVLKGLMPERQRRKVVRVKDARQLLFKEQLDSLLDQERIVREGLRRAEENGIIFLDELDKVAMPEGRRGGAGPDVSREGVQRDLLPVVEGTTVMTKYGPLKTNHILFIAAGAFHQAKPSDLIPELQGRFPIRVELADLTLADLRRILTEPRSALVRQYRALLGADGVELAFTDDALDAVASMAFKVNQETENLGARRLHTVMERLLEDVLFDAPDGVREQRVVIDRAAVEARLSALVGNRDLSKFIL